MSFRVELRRVNMNHIEFNLNKEYITVSQLLKACGIVNSGGIIKHLIAESCIVINDIPCTQRGKKVYLHDMVYVNFNNIETTIKIIEETRNI